MKQNKICFLEDDDERLLEAIPVIKSESDIEIILVTDENKKFEKQIIENCKIIRLNTSQLSISKSKFTSKQIWLYQNFEKLRINYTILGLQTDKKSILKTILNHKDILIKNNNRIYGYAPFYFKKLKRTIFLLDPLIQIRPTKNQLQKIAENFINEYRFYYDGDVSGVFISFAIETDNIISKRWEIILDLKRKNIHNYYYGLTQLDSAVLNELKNNDNSIFGPVNTIIFPDLLSANASFKSLGFAEKEIKSSGILISDIKNIRHAIITRNCRTEQLINLVKDLIIKKK